MPKIMEKAKNKQYHFLNNSIEPKIMKNMTNKEIP